MSLKLKRISAMFVAFALVLVIFLPGCNDKTDPSPGSTVSDTLKHGYQTLSERNAWNIVITVSGECHLGDEFVFIEIRDNDNQGFTVQEGYKLDHSINGEWVELEQNIWQMQEIGRVFPKDDANYTGSAERIYFESLKEEITEAGRYRVTKTISDRPFSVEFDILP